jgi:two-component system chemotaxis sensor kinase CheA
MDVHEILDSEVPPNIEDVAFDNDKLAKFFWKFKGLQLIHERDTSFWEATNDNLQIAYKTLDQKEAELSRAYEQIQQYLDNIREGLLLLDKDLIIQDQYSLFMQELFETQEIAGQNFIDFMYPDANTQKENRQDAERFLQILFTNTIASMSMIMDVNPFKEHHMLFPGELGLNEKVISANFIRIPDDEGQIVNIMVIFQDRTEILQMERRLDEEKKKTDSEISTIRSIMRFGASTFADFMQEIEDLILEYEENYNKISDPQVVENLYSHTHSLKGSARYYELNFLAEITHQLEDKLSYIKESQVSKEDIGRFELEAMVEYLKSTRNSIDNILDQIKNLADSELFAENALDTFINSLKRMTEKLGNDLEKPINFTSIVKVKELPHQKALKDPIIHLLRNALDHGIEDKFERVGKSKKEHGTVILKIYEADNHIYITIEDDGAGFQTEKIFKRAMERKIPHNSELGLAEAIRVTFLPEFSLKRNVSEISGRGFGLHIVKDSVKKLGGGVSVKTKPNIGTRFTIQIPLKARK